MDGLVIGFCYVHGARMLRWSNFWVRDLDVLSLNDRLEDGIWSHILHLLVQFDSFLESITLLHDFFVFNTDHSIIHIHSQIVLLTAVLLLIIKSSFASSKWIHLISLTDLVAKGLHFVLHKLIMQIGSWSRILSNLL